MFGLIATTQKSEGIINIPVLDTMTNGDMARAILNDFTAHFNSDAVKCTKQVKKYVKTLEKDPDGLFIDPCYEICEDYFVLSFKFD